jgi:hypothetical protein
MSECATVSSNQARKLPYPYVYLEEDGKFRELTAEERQYLEEVFHPADGGRPYIKHTLYGKTVDGKLSGFLKRSKLPRGLKVGEALPPEPPPKPWWRFW